MIAFSIRNLSQNSCKNKEYTKLGFVTDVSIQVAMRVFGERDPGNDPKGKQFNIEGACLVGIDLHDEWGVVRGLAGARMSGSKLLHADLTKTELQNTELMGIDAGDRLTEGWTWDIGQRLHNGANNDLRRQYVTHFIDANLTGAKLQGAGLEGADFSGAVLDGAVFTYANISHTNFRGAQKLTVEQLQAACVGSSKHPERVRDEQPYLWEPLKTQLAKAGGVATLCPE